MDRKLVAWLLICISLFLLFNSMQRQRELARLQQEKLAAESERTKTKRANDLHERAEKLKTEDPDFALPDEPLRQRYTLGSMGFDDNYRMLVTLDNQGAGIERIELVVPNEPGKFKYRSLQTKEREGYLGYLAFEETANALVVHSVPKGSPAAAALCKEDPAMVGLQPGDKIIGWDDLNGFPSYYKLDKRLSKHSAGDKIDLQVARPLPPTKSESQPPSTTENNPPSESEEKKESQVEDAVSSQDSLEPAPTMNAPAERILTFTCTMTEKPLDVLRAEDDFFAEQVKGNDPIVSCLMTLASVDKTSIEEGEAFISGLESTLKGRWQAKELDVPNGMGIEFSMPLQAHLRLAGIQANLELVKQYRLHSSPLVKDSERKGPGDWQNHLELTTIVRNLDDTAHTVSIRQNGLNGVSLEGWWYPTKISPYFFSAAGARDVILSDGVSPHSLVTTRSIVSRAINTPLDPEMPLFGPADTAAKRNVKYVGLDTQSFTAAMLPDPNSPASMESLQRARAVVHNSVYRDVNSLPTSKQQAANIGFWFDTAENQVPAKGEWKQTYQIFAGPKDPQLLAAYKLDDALEYGWHIFGFFAKRLGYLLHFFFYLTGNFAVAIMMLTVLVRSLMFPVSRRMALNAQKMQSVQPQMAKLKEAFKDDPRKMMAGQQLLLKKAGINQFAGCLPAMIQLPIVIGLYRCVSVDVALRQRSLIPGWEWCSNLAGPDMMLNWHSWMPDFIAGRGSGWFGPYLNILPIITITLFIIQQKVLMPKAADEQTRMAQQMMMVLTIMMGVLFFKVPAGLCIYFITSSTWSLVERFLIKRFTPKNTVVELPENAASEIIATLSKPGAQPQRVSNTPSNNDRSKPRNTKPPETLADVFPGWFGKKTTEATPAKTNQGSTRPSASMPDRRKKRNKK